MKNIIPEYYRNYGQYSNYRNFPMITDGLKPVERRVLLSAFKIARDKFVKSLQVDAYTIGHYHPHGETYGTIVSLVRRGFLIGQGNFGSNVGVQSVDAAAPRYTECKLSPKMLEMAFKYVKHVEWVDTELSDKEPTHLPTMFPVCLMGNEYTQGIGFGYKTFIPCFATKDLKRRLMWLLGVTKSEPVINPKTDCTITANKKVIKTLLTTGKAKIDVTGVIEEVPHQNKVILKSWPPGKRFESFLKKFQSELDSNMIGFTDLSVTETQIVFQVIRQRNRDNIYQEFVSKLKEMLVGMISFDMVMVNENHEVVVTGVDSLLKNSYTNYKNAVGRMLEHEIDGVLQTSTDYKTLLRMRPALKRHMSGKEKIEHKVKRIASESNVAEDSVERLLKLNIKRLLTMEVDIDDLKNKLKVLQDNLTNLDGYVLEKYQSL